MAVDVGRSPPEAPGGWDCTEVEKGCPEPADSLRRLLGPGEAEPCPWGTGGVAMSRHSRLATGVTQGGSSCHPQVSSASASGFPRTRASLLETEKLICRATDDGEVLRHVSHQFLSSEEQQVKAPGCWEVAPSPPSRRSSAEESVLTGGCRDARAGRGSRSLGAQSPVPSTPELLQPQTPPSPESTPRSRSASCFSPLSSEAGGRSEEPSPGVGAGTVQGLHCPGGAAGGGALRPCEPSRPLRGLQAPGEPLGGRSSYQADYWACAIPESLPPSPDRRSPHWNPNKEYEDLLDYAYPLKPRHRLGKMLEPFLHDSGIGLDSFSASPQGTSRSASIYGRDGQAGGGGENGCRKLVASAERSSTPRPGKRGCSGAGSCYEPLPMAKEFSFSKSDSSRPSRGFAKDVPKESARPGASGRPAAEGGSWCATGSPFPTCKGQVKSTKSFLATTGVLPLRKEWEGDEEFLSLPPRLRELERLAQFLSNLSLTIRMPGHDHQNLPRHSNSRQPLLSELSPFREVGGRDSRGSIGDYAGRWHPSSSRKPSWENTESRGQIHREPLQGLHLPASLRDTLDGTYLSEPRVKGHPKKSQQSESLAQCVKMFCCQLEELIHWLYNVVEVTESWAPASPDAESVRASLHRCLEFKKDVADHRSLTESVLERGEALLDCMASSSPALRDTLGLIAEQSAELETRAEHLYESALAAAGPGRGRGVQQAAAQWVLPLSELALAGQSRDG